MVLIKFRNIMSFSLLKSNSEINYPFKYSCQERYSVMKSRNNFSKYPFKFTKEDLKETEKVVNEITTNILDDKLKTII